MCDTLRCPGQRRPAALPLLPGSAARHTAPREPLMFYPFLALAAVSPGRQLAFRRAVVGHVLLLGGGVWAALRQNPRIAPLILGQLLLVAGIVEGAILLGWRLTQLPKSQALEFLLVTPLRPWRVFLAEATVGLCRLALVTLSGLPLLTLLVVHGLLAPVDLVPLLGLPFTWGAITGLGLTMWAYEPAVARRLGERLLLVLIILYLAVGVLVGEHLKTWIAWLPDDLGRWFLFSFKAFHRYNPFASMQHWAEVEWRVAWERTVGVEAAALALLVVLLARAAARLGGHFHERHYRPAVDPRAGTRQPVSDRPLAWWAVRRVAEYAGRVNLWLAGGFGVLYALYTVAGPYWPSWMGQRVFHIFDRMGGVPVLATALVVLAAVPAAYQYGLWDSNAQERCRRLELLLLTRLEAEDYWEAAAAAAWFRGRGYFLVAGLLWLAAVFAGQLAWYQALGAVAAGAVLWSLYFAAGFRAFARGLQANSLGLLLTVGFPLVTYGLYQLETPALAALVPPGTVFAASAGAPASVWLPGALAGAAAALLIGWQARAGCDSALRRWYDRHHGQKLLE